MAASFPVIEYFIRYRSRYILAEEDGDNGFTPVSVVSRQVIDDSLLLRARGTKEAGGGGGRDGPFQNYRKSLSLSLSADLLARSARPRNGIVAI